VKPELRALELSDPPERWAALGFEVGEGGDCRIGEVVLKLGSDGGPGIVGWSVSGVDDAAVDGLAVMSSPPALDEAGPAHPNGAIGLDHVVVVTGAFDRTAEALQSAGLPLRRIRDAGGFRQGFRRLGPAILELVEAVGQEPDGPARFWGLVVIVDDLEGLAGRLGDLLKPIKPAVQPGRRIATLGRAAGLGAAVAFMDADSAV
jgi:hypothetical protein